MKLQKSFNAAAKGSAPDVFHDTFSTGSRLFKTVGAKYCTNFGIANINVSFWFKLHLRKIVSMMVMRCNEQDCYSCIAGRIMQNLIEQFWGQRRNHGIWLRHCPCFSFTDFSPLFSQVLKTFNSKMKALKFILDLNCK